MSRQESPRGSWQKLFFKIFGIPEDILSPQEDPTPSNEEWLEKAYKQRLHDQEEAERLRREALLPKPPRLLTQLEQEVVNNIILVLERTSRHIKSLDQLITPKLLAVAETEWRSVGYRFTKETVQGHPDHYWASCKTVEGNVPTDAWKPFFKHDAESWFRWVREAEKEPLEEIRKEYYIKKGGSINLHYEVVSKTKELEKYYGSPKYTLSVLFSDGEPTTLLTTHGDRIDLRSRSGVINESWLEQILAEEVRRGPIQHFSGGGEGAP